MWWPWKKRQPKYPKRRPAEARITIYVEEEDDVGKCAMFLAIHNVTVEIKRHGDTEFTLWNASVDVFFGGLHKDLYFNVYAMNEEQFGAPDDPDIPF
jgi:hypothetical protein